MGGVTPTVSFTMDSSLPVVFSPVSDSGIPKNRRLVRREYCSSLSRSASHEDSLASRAAIYLSFFSNRSLSCDICSVNVSSLSVRAFGLSTWRNFWITASFDKSSTNLTSRASSLGHISVVSEALYTLRLGRMRTNYLKKIRHKNSKFAPSIERCHTLAAILKSSYWSFVPHHPILFRDWGHGPLAPWLRQC